MLSNLTELHAWKVTKGSIIKRSAKEIMHRMLSLKTSTCPQPTYLII